MSWVSERNGARARLPESLIGQGARVEAKLFIGFVNRGAVGGE